MSDVTIRAAIAEDHAHVVQLLRSAGLPVDGLDEQFGPAYAVAVADGAIVGAEGMERYLSLIHI